MGTCGAAGDAAKDKDEGGDKIGADQNAGRRETIRGFIAGVTVEGETVVDTRWNRAVTAEMDFLTIVGSTRVSVARRGGLGRAGATGGRRGQGQRSGSGEERDGDRTVSASRRHYNVYIVRLAPRPRSARPWAATGVATAREGSIGPRPTSTAWRSATVEVTFLCRDEAGASDNANAKNASRKHGRHRTYFGDALTITLLPDHGPRERSAASRREGTGIAAIGTGTGTRTT